MGKWKGEADVTKETAGGGGNNFPPAPRGFYTIQVADITEGETRGNPEKGTPSRPKIDLECEIADQGEQFGKKVWLTITHIGKTEKGHGLMIHQLHAFGLALDGNYDFETSELQGRQARALIGITQREKTVNAGTPQEKKYINDVNFIEEVYTEKHPEPADGVMPPAREPYKKEGAKPAANGVGRTTAPAAVRKPQQQEVPF